MIDVCNIWLPKEPEPVYFDSETAVKKEIQWKNRLAQQESEQEERDFLSDPHYAAASTGERFSNLEV